ncbi:MAG: PAS domain S-box protein, partial [Nitriliruptoraceae bacterium]
LDGASGRDEAWWRGRWWDVRVEPQRVDDVVDHVLVMILDITDRVQRREAEGTVSAIIGTSAMALVSLDLEGTVTGWSRGAADLFGWSAEEILGESLSLLDVEGYDGYTVAEGLRRLHEDRLEEGYVEVVRRHRDGHVVHVGVTMAYIRDGGQKTGSLAVYRDLTEREEARQALAASEEQFHLIAENIQDVVYRLALDPEPQLDYVSPSIEGVLGLPAEEFLADLSTLTSRVHPDDLPDVTRMLREPVRSTGSFRWRWQHADGDWVWLEDHRNLILHAGRPVALVGVIRDVTDEQRDIDQTREALEHERRVADELRRVDTMKTTFLSAVSHEVRTPLTSIIGFSETAMRLCDHSDVNQDARAMLDRVMANARRLERLVDDLLDVDRLSRGNVEPRRVPTDLAALVRRIVDEAERTSHRLALDLEPVVLSVDVSMIERVVDNLVRNAQRHTPDGTTVDISLAAVGSGARIVVEDDGPGIEPGLRDLLFEPFEQGASPASSHSPGTGIGLSLVERFVEIHGGRVTLDGRPGGGARFTVDLPPPA